MSATRPTGEQIRFRSAKSGEHILDTYLEAAEIGNRQLYDLLDDLFDASNSGALKTDIWTFRYNDSAKKLQVRSGDATMPFADITSFFNSRGTFSTSTTYQNFDLVTVANSDVYIVDGLSSGQTFGSEAAFTSSANTTKLIDVSGAETHATAAAASASSASSSATSSASSASTATTQAATATTKASEAATSASSAATAKTAAETAQTAAESAKASAESARDSTLEAYDNFDDRYLGTKSSDPTVDNDGNALVAGALYFDSVSGAMKVYTGSAWTAAYVSGTGYLALSGGTMTGQLNGTSASFSGNATVSGNIELGHASDTTISRSAAGTVTIEGAEIRTGTVAVPNGGTGATSLTDGGVLLGSGTGAITAMGVLGDGEVIVGDGSGDPVAESGATLRASIGVGTSDSPTFTGLTLTGNADIDGTTNLDAVDIDGAVQIDGTVTVGVDDTGYDVTFYGDTASAYMKWDTSQDDLILGGAARLGIGATSPNFALTAAGADAATNMMLQSTAGSYRLGFYTDSSQQRLSTYNATAMTFAITESEKMRLDTGGRFLINKSTTQTANAPLQVASSLGTGQIFVGNTSGTGYMFGRDNVTTGNFVLGEVSNDADTSVTNLLNIATGTGNATFIGMVGVGVVPTEELHLKAAAPTIRLEDSDNNLSGYINGDNGNVLLQSHNVNRDIIFGENAASGEFARIVGVGGKVGIGTTAPGYLLEVKANDTATGGQLFINQAGTGDPGIRIGTAATSYMLGVDNSDSDTFKIDYGTTGVGAQTGISLNTSGNVGIGTSTPDGKVHIHKASAGTVTANANADELVIEDSGFAGLSILTPASGLGSIIFGDPDDNDVASVSYDHSANTMRFYTNGGEKVRIDGYGRMGIGTSTPGAELEIAGDYQPLIINSTTSSGAKLIFEDNGTVRGYLGGASSMPLTVYKADGVLIGGFDTSGNFKVQPTSSTQTIKVQSSNGGAEMEMRTDGGGLTTIGSTNNVPTAIQAQAGEKMRVVQDGKVGIGTTSPTAKLEVNGTVLASTDTDTSNSGSVTLDFTANQNFVLTLTGNVTLANPSVPEGSSIVGQAGVMVLIQDASGSRTLSLSSDFESPGGGGIALSTAANAVDVVPYFVKASGSIQLGTPQLAFS